MSTTYINNIDRSTFRPRDHSPVDIELIDIETDATYTYIKINDIAWYAPVWWKLAELYIDFDQTDHIAENLYTPQYCCYTFKLLNADYVTFLLSDTTWWGLMDNYTEWHREQPYEEIDDDW